MTLSLRHLSTLLFVATLLISSCADNTPWLPADLEKEQGDLDTSWVHDDDTTETTDNDIEIDDNELSDDDRACSDGFSNYRGECVAASLAVVGVESWNLPESGHFLFSSAATFETLKEVELPFPLGSSDGTDVTLSATSEKLLIIGRDHHSFVAEYGENSAREVWRTTDEESGYINLQDGFFDEKLGRYCFVGLSSNDLLCFSGEKLTKTALKIPEEHTFYSPARVLKIDRTVWITLQLLNDEWQSDGGAILKIDLDTMEMISKKLPLANPYGRIAWNPAFDEKHAFVACTGNWQKRDGGLVRIDLETLKSEVILEESDKKGTILDGDFVDVQPTNDGNLYLILSDNRTEWDNVLLLFDVAKGTLKEVDRGLNAFAPLPLAYNPISEELFYFVDEKEKTFLVKIDKNGEKERFLMEWGASAVAIFMKKYDGEEK